MSDDYLIQAILGMGEGFAKAYVPHTQAVREDALTRRREEEKFERDKELLGLKGEQTIDILSKSPHAIVGEDGSVKYVYGKTARTSPVAKPDPELITPETLRQRESEGLQTPSSKYKVGGGAQPKSSLPNELQTNLERAAETVVRDATDALKMMETSDIFQEAKTGIGKIAKAYTRKGASMVAGTDTYEIQKLIDSIKSNIGIDALLNIKREGSGLGQVPQKQLETLQEVLGKMDISRGKLLKRDIEDVLEKYQEIVRVAKLDREKKGGLPAPTPQGMQQTERRKATLEDF